MLTLTHSSTESPGPPPGWLAVTDGRLGGAAIPLALLHPAHGVVLVGGPVDGPARLRERLAAGRFQAIFHGTLPIARAETRPADPLVALAGLPPLDLPGGEAWVAAARRALATEAPAGGPQRPGIRARQRQVRRRLALVLGSGGALLLAAAVGIATLPASPGPYVADPRLAGDPGMPPPADEAPPAPAYPPSVAVPRRIAQLAVPPPPGPVAPAPVPPRTDPLPPEVAAIPPPVAPAPRAMSPEWRPPPASIAAIPDAPARTPEPEMRFQSARDARLVAQPIAPVARCRLITQRMQIGETVPDADIRFLRLGCPG